MKHKFMLLVGVGAVLTTLAIPAQAAAPVKLTAKLKGSEEVPGPGDRNGRGEISMSVKRAQRTICFQLAFERIQDPTAGHIHKGADGVSGPIKVTLFTDSAGIPGPTAEGCVRRLGRKLLRRIARRPERFYVNLHNPEFPDGAIRGQLEKAR